MWHTFFAVLFFAAASVLACLADWIGYWVSNRD